MVNEGYCTVHYNVFAGDSKKEETAPQKEEEDVTDYGKAAAKLKSGEKKQHVPKV